MYLPSKQFVKQTAGNMYGASKWYANVGNKFDRAVVTPTMNRAVQKFGGMSKFAPSGLNELALTTGVAVFMAQSTFDPTVNDSRITHIGKNLAAGAIDSMAFALNPYLGVGLAVANVMGLPTPGDIGMGAMEAISKSLDFNKYGRKTVTQNERTMRATSSNLALIGQGGSHTSLGNEAMLMHN